jgi:hypothetical protein
MKKPKEEICKKCGEKIYGFTNKDLKYKMVMHWLKHREQKEETKDE